MNSHTCQFLTLFLESFIYEATFLCLIYNSLASILIKSCEFILFNLLKQINSCTNRGSGPSQPQITCLVSFFTAGCCKSIFSPVCTVKLPNHFRALCCITSLLVLFQVYFLAGRNRLFSDYADLLQDVTCTHVV